MSAASLKLQPLQLPRITPLTCWAARKSDSPSLFFHTEAVYRSIYKPTATVDLVATNLDHGSSWPEESGPSRFSSECFALMRSKT